MILNQLANYVGSDIVVYNELYLQNHNGNEFGILNGIYPLYNKDKKIFWQYTTDVNSTGNPISNCKPLLKPLADLGKPLKNNVIPILFCAHYAGLHVSNFHDIESQKFKCYIEKETIILERLISPLSNRYEGFEIDLDNFGFNCFYVNKYKKGREYKEQINVVSNPQKIISYLYSKGFDIDNLIKQDLALNINNFPQFQY